VDVGVDGLWSLLLRLFLLLLLLLLLFTC